MKIFLCLSLILIGCAGEDYRECSRACKESGLQMHSAVSGPNGSICTCGGSIQKEKEHE